MFIGSIPNPSKLSEPSCQTTATVEQTSGSTVSQIDFE